jgi:hypothetical protein
MNFRKIFYESLPVEERDDYQDWLRKQKDIAAVGPKLGLINRKLEKCIKIFFNDFLGLPLEPYYAQNGRIYFEDNRLFEYPKLGGIGETYIENVDLIESQANKVISDYQKAFSNCCDEASFETVEGDAAFRFKLNFKGVDRVSAGPLVGKLKKAGFEVLYLRNNYKSLTIYFEEGFDDVKKFNELFGNQSGAGSLFEFFKELENN